MTLVPCEVHSLIGSMPVFEDKVTSVLLYYYFREIKL